MSDDKYFGNLRVGSVVDCLAVPGDESAVIDLVTRELRKMGSDLVVTNQSHAQWVAAFGKNGYLSAPSNFILACSPELIAGLGPLEQELSAIHINRADGDGPIHL
jgi:hypothetical protein